MLNLDTVGFLPKTAYGLGHRDLRQSQYRRQLFRSGHDPRPEPGESFGHRPRDRRLVIPLAAVILFIALTMTSSRAASPQERSAPSHSWCFVCSSDGETVNPISVWTCYWLVYAQSPRGSLVLFSARIDVADNFAAQTDLYADVLRMIDDRSLLAMARRLRGRVSAHHSSGVDSAFVWKHAHSTWLEAFRRWGSRPVALLAMIVYVSLGCSAPGAGRTRCRSDCRRAERRRRSRPARINRFQPGEPGHRHLFVSLLGLAIGQQLRLRRAAGGQRCAAWERGGTGATMIAVR